MTRLPLPLPARYPEEGTSGIDYTADQMRDYAAAENAALRERVKVLENALSLAYGHLWCINTEPGTPSPIYRPEAASYVARKILQGMLTTEQRGNGINAARAALGASK